MTLPERGRPSPPDRAAAERAVLWSTAFNRFFGARYGREELPAALRPMSCGETSRELAKLAELAPHTVRRCICQMLASGYVPDRHNVHQFRDLARKAVRPQRSRERAIARLRAVGRREYVEAYDELAQRHEPAMPPRARRVIALPTEITFRGDVFTVRKEVLVPSDLRRVARFVQPENWPLLGPFWDKKAGGLIQVDKKNERIFERFVINWNKLTLEVFQVHLRFRYGENAEGVRTDYSLMYEEDGKLLVDEGYGEVRRIPGRQGWTRHTAVKTLKFAATLQNLLSPAVMAMFLESTAAAFQKRFGRRARH
jgi:hypothetical protein